MILIQTLCSQYRFMLCFLEDLLKFQRKNCLDRLLNSVVKGKNLQRILYGMNRDCKLRAIVLLPGTILE